MSTLHDPNNQKHKSPSASRSDATDRLVVKRPLTVSLTIALLLGVIIPVSAAMLFVYYRSASSSEQLFQAMEQDMKENIFKHLVAVREIKKYQIEEYFTREMLDTEIFTRSQDVITLFDKLHDYHETSGATADTPFVVGTPEYKKIADDYGKYILQYDKDMGTYNIFMIYAPHGHVMFSAKKRADLGTNLANGPYKDSDLAKLWAKVKSTGKSAFIDFAPYAPAGGDPTAFMGTPLRDKNGRIIGVIAVQLSVNQIDHVMQERDGMGETGETYLVGPDRLMRSDSYIDPKNHSVKASFANPATGSVDTEAVNAALQGKNGENIIDDYNGSRVLSAYTPIKVFGDRWALIAEINEKEAFGSVFENQKNRDEALASMAVWTAVLWGVCLLTIVLVGGWVHHYVARPIRNIAMAAVAVARGDLNVRVPAKGKSETGVLARAIQSMVDGIRNIAEQVNTAGAKMVSASREQAEGAKNQSTATEQMSGAATELMASAKQMTESGSSVTGQAEQAADECNSGTTSIQNAIQGINGIHERVEKIANYMAELGGKSQQISGVLDIITELSEQTNLLSLNASIEAAGAGEAGKRFAVVASEIRKLAERAGDSTGEIRNLIDSVQKTINATIMATEEGTKAAQEGVRLTKEVDESFTRIAERVTSTRQSAKVIEMGSRQQATAIGQLEKAVKEVDSSAQETASTANQLDANAHALLEAAKQLQNHEQQAV